MLGRALRMLSQCGDLREDGAGLASDEGCFPAWACRPTENHPNKHCGAASLTRPDASYDATVRPVLRWPVPYCPVRPPLIKSATPRTTVTRPDSASTSSTVLITGVTAASARATPTAAGPSDEPSRPASITPDPWGASAAAKRATLTPWLPASLPSEPPLITTAAFDAPMCWLPYPMKP